MCPKLCFIMLYAKFVVLFIFYVEIYSLKLEYCDFCPSHVLCKYKTSGPGEWCQGYDEQALLSKDDIEAVVNKINERRNFVALGQARNFRLPQAANMRKISWSEELATFAQRWADQCDKALHPDSTDECRNLVNQEVGQNIASISGWSPGLNVKSFVDIWFMNSLNYKGTVSYYNRSLDHPTQYFTQLIWAETDSVGCGKARFYIDKVLLERLVCNFAPRGNVHAKPIYIIGIPATQCPEGMKQDRLYPGLCTSKRNELSTPTFSSPVSSLLRILNLFNDTITEAIDPVESDTKQQLQKIDERYQKTRHIFNRTNDPQNLGLLAINNPWNFINLSRRLNQEKGHSRLYHTQDHPKTSQTTEYNNIKVSQNSGHDFRRQMQNGPIPIQVIQQCTRRLPLPVTLPATVPLCVPQPNCFVKQCTRGPKNCCIQPACSKTLCYKPSCHHQQKLWSCSEYATTCAPAQDNCQCIEVKNCCGPMPPPLPLPPRPPLQAPLRLQPPPPPTPPPPPLPAPLIPLPISSVPFGCPFRRHNMQHIGTSRRPDFHYYDLFPNLALRDGEDTRDLDPWNNINKEVVSAAITDDSWIFDSTITSKVSLPISNLQSKINLHQNLKLSQNPLQISEKPYPNNDYYDFLVSVQRIKRDSDDETSYKPFWQMEEEKFSKPLQLKSLKYTTLPKRKRKTRSTITKITEPITMLSEEDGSYHQHSIKEKYMSFEELMNFRKNTAEHFDYRRRERPFLRDKQKSNIAADKSATAGKASSSTTTTTTTTTSAITTAATTPTIPKIKSCSRKLTCTWTTPTIPGNGNEDGNGNVHGKDGKAHSRHVHTTEQGCSRTLTCTREQMDKNILIPERPKQEGEDEDGNGNGDSGAVDSAGAEGDEDYCERRSLNVKRRDSENSEDKTVQTKLEFETSTNMFASNSLYQQTKIISSKNTDYLLETNSDCICSFENNTKEKRHAGHIILSENLLSNNVVTGTHNTKTIVSYQNLYNSVLSRLLKRWKRNHKNQANACLCNKSFFIVLCSKLTIVILFFNLFLNY